MRNAMRLQAKIQKWGNSLGLRLTGPMRAVPDFRENMIVDVDVSEEGLTIVPADTANLTVLPFTEGQLLSGLDSETSHADELATLTTKELEN